jgi:hypothetical protein
MGETNLISNCDSEEVFSQTLNKFSVFHNIDTIDLLTILLFRFNGFSRLALVLFVTKL